ncbi:MAG: hypothetical protein CVV21_00600 [Candidatus Goldiibacteriota bacterium HGW-Goldbacteria-1]|jgi:hypothetical protein|nr:MAG: hypothetical protein CVV21_00600 [Candidatus Goldiibacteriota bacterium HGW-Goldbacteria-1]
MIKNLLKMRIIIGTLFLIIIHTSIFADTCNLPFPQGQDYPYGLRPNNYTQAQMNQHVQAWFDKWRAKYLTQNNCAVGEWRVQRTETGNTIHKGCPENDTVSEGIAYGMVVCVYMSSATNNTKQYFDGMWNYYQNHLDGNGLMNWQIPYCDSGGAAIDADQDVVQALIMADKQWGSGGAINYRNEAIALAAKVLQYEITAANDIRPGDGWDGGNPSYFAPYTYRMIGDYTGVTRWYSVASRTYNTIVKYYYNSSMTYDSALGIYTGLQPNWCNYDGTSWSPGDWAMESGTWWWDAIRHAWRQGYDYVLYGTLNHQLAQDNSFRVSQYFKTKYSGAPSLIKSHYQLNGTEHSYCRDDRTPDLCDEDVMNLPGPVGAVAVAAMAGQDQNWLNALYNRLVTMDAGNGPGELTETGVMWGTDYFCDLLKMQYMLVLTGNMPNPNGNYPTPTHTYTWDPAIPTFTPTPTVAAGMFDDFETGVLSNPDTSESGGGSTATLTNSTADKYEGARSMRVDTTGTGWALISINSPYDGGYGYRDFTGAAALTFYIKAPAGKAFFIQLTESMANGGDGERFSNRGNALTTTGAWQPVTINLSSLTRDQYTPAYGDNALDIQAIQSFVMQLENPGTTTAYVDRIMFTGTFPTATHTATSTPTRTLVNTYTFTYTATSTNTVNPMWTHTFTNTYTNTATNTNTYTVTNTATQTPTLPPIPFGVFDNFESTMLESPNSETDGSTIVTLANTTEDKHSGTRALKITFSTPPSNWGAVGIIGSPYNQAADPEYYINFTGADTMTFWIKAKLGDTFFIKLQESDAAGADGEYWSNRGGDWTGTGAWQLITVNLADLGVDPYSGNQGGNKTLDLQAINDFAIQFNAGTPGPIYIDDIEFSGMSTPTQTPTVQSTSTYTYTFTNTYTNTNTATATYTYTETSTNTPEIPTYTATYTYTGTDTATYTHTYTSTATATNTNTFTSTHTATVTDTPPPGSTDTHTFTVTNTFTNTATYTNTPTDTNTYTATYTNTPTYTYTNTNTGTNTHTATITDTPPPGSTNTHTFTVTNTSTNTATYTYTDTATNTSTHTATVPTATYTYTATNTNTATSTNTFTNTNTATITNTVPPGSTNTYTHTVTNTFTNTHTFTNTNTAVPATFTYTYTQVITQTATYTATSVIVPTSTYTPTSQPTETDKLEIKDRLVYPCPWNTDSGQSLKIRFTATKRFTSARIFIYTVNFRQIRMLETPGGHAGQNIIEIHPNYLKNLSNGSYYYLITARDTAGKEVRAKVDKILILK